MQGTDAAWLYGPWSPSICIDIPLSLAGLESPLKRDFAGRAPAPCAGQVKLDNSRRETRHARWRGKRGVGDLGDGGHGIRDGAGGPARARAKTGERGRGKGLAERWINYFTGDYVLEAQQRQALVLAQAQLQQNSLCPRALSFRAAPSGLPLEPRAFEAPLY